jgi:hypothetical protein
MPPVRADQVAITRHPLDRVPLSLIVDDSCPLVNLNYFFLRDRIAHTGKYQRWEDVPVVIPESFTREWGEWCLETGVKGKYSVVPCPAGIGRIDQGLPLFGQQQLDSWLAMCREVIVPNFDITPEMLTHTFVLDLETLQPLPSRIWEQYEWQSFSEADAEFVKTYITLACQILANVGLPPEGVTSPGGFGGKVLPLYIKLAGEAVRSVTGNPTPYVFKRVSTEGSVESPVWYVDRAAGTAVGETIACVGDYTGSWTGYGEANPDRYIAEDLRGGRLPQVIDAGDPCVLVSHWQGFYGMHDADRRGFHTLKTVVERLRALDPHGERTRWRKTSEITNYACARDLADITIAEGTTIHLDLPVLVPELTLRIRGARPNSVTCDGKPLRRVGSMASFESGTYLMQQDDLLLAYDPHARRSTISLH